ncbi:hypothetical protein A8709_19875 [Paenibacillus pectinilyticus]|uniref:Flagellar hook-length control protein-like C-terminal domain-containing protein n=1 Tax=Paenibacillus pectinilyticus TaxID=512399 RepID=A0A1C1A0C7_9BACL|nr:hypothetical protein [Paenibacillus pectinilyticus]OCT13834.1 hypothetical protein A8709_19875 [Paenibacillus pectinilyticus]
MNISGLIRNLVGDLTASDPKVLELKVGQIIKGVVLQLLNDQEALLNIGGTQVRAKLETPLKQGDVTMLQVQPESQGGQIILKPLVASDVQITDDSLGELLKAFEVKDSAGTRQMVQQMQQAGVPVSKENVKAFEAVMSEMPQGENKEEWLQAAILVSKKGLPLTPTTVNAVKQVTTGPPVGQVFEQLEQQVTNLLEQEPTHPAVDTAKQVVSVLRELRATAAAARPAELAAPASATTAPAAVQASATAAAPAAAAPQEPAPAAPQAGADEAAPRGSVPAAAASAAPPAATAAGEEPPAPAAQPATALAVSAEPAAEGKAQARSAEPLKGEPLQAGSPAPVRAQEPPAKQEGVLAAKEARVSAPQAPPADPETNWISKMLKAVGVEHESQVAAKLDERGNAIPIRQQAADDAFTNIFSNTSDQQGDTVKPAADTLKSLLLQLTASDDTPAPVKEAAQQAVAQITGQQLMLTNDKNAMFAQMTLFVPFVDNTGQQSAAIHIQSRKGSRGEVDASNCRLLFDLQMKVMGNTLLDVQVVNKIVSLNVHNDHPALAGLMESSKEDIAAAMSSVGYQFISLKCSPYPKPPEIQEGKEGLAKLASLDGRADLRELYSPLTYKGVDVRA